MHRLASRLVDCLLGQARIRDRCRLDHHRGQHALAEQTAQEGDDLRLRSIVGLIAGDQIAHPVIIEIAACLLDHGQKVGGHRQELVHRRHVEHLRMDGDENRGGGAESRQCQEAEGRRAIDDDDIVALLQRMQRIADPHEEHVLVVAVGVGKGL